jgi:hypothetical protein
MKDEEAIILPKHEATDNKTSFRLNILKVIAQNTATIYISQSAKRKREIKKHNRWASRIKYSIVHVARMVYFKPCVGL